MSLTLCFGFAKAVAQTTLVTETPPFQVQLSLTSAALAALTARGEQLRIFGYYFGAPKPGVITHQGEVDLHSSFDVSGESLTDSISVPSKHLGAIGLQNSDRVMLLVNVVSARRSSPNNLLSCDIYEGVIPTKPGGRITLHCGLIVESPDVKMVSSF